MTVAEFKKNRKTSKKGLLFNIKNERPFIKLTDSGSYHLKPIYLRNKDTRKCCLKGL